MCRSCTNKIECPCLADTRPCSSGKYSKDSIVSSIKFLLYLLRTLVQELVVNS